MRIGELIRKHRLRAGLSKEGLALRAGYSRTGRTRVYGVEYSLERYDSAPVRKFIAALGIPEAELMQCSDVPLEAHAAWMANQLGADVAGDVPVQAYAAALNTIGE